MSDVFVSYARSTEPHAVRIVDALRTLGYRVWRDDEIPAHRAYAEVIEERLRGAKAVVVIWSAEAVKSQWVRAEADIARQAGTLVQASLDGTMPPMPFNQIHCADLRGWDGEPTAPGWRKLEKSVAALVGQRQGPVPTPDETVGPWELAVCVLPFVNMSGDAEQEYFSDGISEDITTDLSQVSALKVIARNTAFMFKGQSVDVRDVARRLGVSHVLEGSVRRAGERVRITAQLIDGRTCGHVWAERYDRDLTDIFAIQDEISKAIVAALKVKLLPEEKKAIAQRGTFSPEAYDLYLMARQYWTTGNHGDRRRDERVVRLCGRAVEIDPQYARAWALMALAQDSLRFSFSGKSTVGGLAAAETALELDSTIAEAHCVKARNFLYEGRDSEAETEINLALQLEPESWEVNKEVARIRMLQGRIPEATRHCEKAASLVETDYHSWGMLATCYRKLGHDELLKHAAEMMISQSEKVLEQDPSNGAALGMVASGFAILGDAGRAKEVIGRALLIDPDNLYLRYNFACILANYTGQHEAAIELLGTALAKGGSDIVNIAMVDPDMDPLRDDARFQKMLSNARARLDIKTAAPTTPAGI